VIRSGLIKAERFSKQQMATDCRVCARQAEFKCSHCPNVSYCSIECQRLDWDQHSNECNFTLETRRAEQEKDHISNISHYVDQLYIIIKPVVATILLSMLWIKLTNPLPLYFATGQVRIQQVTLSSSLGVASGGADSSSLVVAGIIMAQIVVFTVMIALLFKFKKAHYLVYVFWVIVFGILAYFSYSLLSVLITIYMIRIDWITFVTIIWNFVGLGMVAIFWKAPLGLQQFYLIIMSSLMAYSLSALPGLVTWILLGFLAVWDLVAVLLPYGPLRVMIEAAQEHNQEIPAAIIYTTMVSFMASPGIPPNTTSKIDEPLPSLDPSPNLLSHAMRLEHEGFGISSSDDVELLDMRPNLDSSEQLQSNHGPSAVEKESGLKLGLGDFVFYSVLVGRVSLSDWVTTVSCMIAVISGLIATIFILVLLKKPLPALPISIFFGGIFYFVGSLTLLPMIQQLMITSPPAQQGFSAGVVGAAFQHL
jgi:presenilin 1